jgi:hypothetical protein
MQAAQLLGQRQILGRGQRPGGRIQEQVDVQAQVVLEQAAERLQQAALQMGMGRLVV